MIRAVMAKELRDVTREKTLVTAFLIQALLAGFSALLLTGLTALHSPEAIAAAPPARVAVIDEGPFAAYLRATDNLDVSTSDANAALAAFRAGDIDIIVQEGLASDGVATITLVLPRGELGATLLATQFKSVLLDYEKDLRVASQHRLDTTIVALPVRETDTSHGFVYGTLLPILTLAPVLLAGAMAGDGLGQEARSRTLLVLRSTPITPAAILVAKLAVPILLIPVQVLLWLGLLAVNGYPAAGIGLILAYVLGLGLLLAGTGTLTASLVPGEASSQAVVTLATLGWAVASLLLPRDPLNVIAILATGGRDAATITTIGATIALGATVLVIAAVATHRRLLAGRL